MKLIAGNSNRKLAEATSDCGWGTFRAMAEYKAARYGRHMIQGKPLRRSAMKHEPRPVRAGIPVL